MTGSFSNQDLAKKGDFAMLPISQIQEIIPQLAIVLA